MINRRSYTLALFTSVYFFHAMDRQVFTILVEPIRTDFAFSDTQMGFLGGLTFAVCHTLAAIPIARWADIGVRKNIVALAIMLWSTATALTATARGFYSMFLFRVGVGLGEAGCTPPIHSVLSDLYPERQRASAISIYSMGMPLGLAAGTLLGGWIGDAYGWRTAFLVCGLPGVLVGMVIYLTVREPPRGLSATQDSNSLDNEPQPFGTVMQTLWSRKSYVHLCLGGGIISAGLGGMFLFLPSFLIRTHGFSLSEVSTYLFFSSLASTGGIYLGGALVGRLGTHDRRWYMAIPALSIILMAPVFIVMFTIDHAVTAAILVFPMQFLLSLIPGPTFSATQMLAPQRMRATASACYLVVVNLIGVGLGPLIAGIISDSFRSEFGDDSIRYALLVLTMGASVWAILHFAAAARTVRDDPDVPHTTD